MSFVSSSCLANAGLYRQTIEQMMYGPPEPKETKKEFHDETLAKIKKVTKLKERFESGILNLTVDESVVKDVVEKVTDKIDVVDECDGPVFQESAPPTPKTRTKFAQATPQALNKGLMGCFEMEKRCDVVDTPILRSTTATTPETKRFGITSMETPKRSSVKRLDFLSESTQLIDPPILTSTPVTSPNPKRHGIILQSMETPKRFSGKRLDFSSKSTELVETPILRNPSRRVSGVSLIDSYLTQMKIEKDAPSEHYYAQTSHIEHPRQKTHSSGSSGSTDSCRISDYMETPKQSCAKHLNFSSKTAELVETPILRTASRQESGISLIDAQIDQMKTQLATSVHHYPEEPNYVWHPRQKTHSSGSSGSTDSCRTSDSMHTPKQSKRLDAPAKSTQLIETPILRTASRQVSGISFNQDHLAPMEPPAKSSYVEHPRQKTHSSGSSGSSDSCRTCASVGTPKSVKKNESPASFNTRNSDYNCKLARAQVHNKFSIYYNWSTGSIRGIAIAVSRMRLKILRTIPPQCRDERIEHMITIYENCYRGVNKELDAVCCALFDLVDDVYETTLSVHEEYVATKYRKKFDQLYA
ncbi:hypothetical protein CAEBREN_05528 [Caenorhabditis brenneri]|uniref:Uncharacterized protein n=1 Tax=Caenorhabditis brenneri TaxID=135651 RepID=G0MBH0_CAEBE|nr:hypothetical protein CAEBREN_05528 [Caenorhabditis brenneri]